MPNEYPTTVGQLLKQLKDVPEYYEVVFYFNGETIEKPISITHFKNDEMVMIKEEEEEEY